jgi:hypothetical protein
MFAKIEWFGPSAEYARIRTCLRAAHLRRTDLPQDVRNKAERVLSEPEMNRRLKQLVDEVGACADDRFDTSRPLLPDELARLFENPARPHFGQVDTLPAWAF